MFRCECQLESVCKHKDALEQALKPIIPHYGPHHWHPNVGYKTINDMVKIYCSERIADKKKRK